MNDNINERRKNRRTYRNFILSYNEKGKSIINHNVSQVNNVSIGGLSFTSTYPLKPGTLVTIDLKTPFIADSLTLDGTVLESREKIADMIYEVRLQFQNIPDDAFAVLKRIESYGEGREG